MERIAAGEKLYMGYTKEYIRAFAFSHEDIRGTCYCDPSKAAKELDWTAQFGIEEMCRDSWNWQSKNPNGYRD